LTYEKNYLLGKLMLSVNFGANKNIHIGLGFRRYFSRKKNQMENLKI